MTTEAKTSTSLVLRCGDGREELVTNFRLDGERILLWGKALSASFPVEVVSTPSGDCDRTGHRWSRWSGYLVSKTDFKDGLYNTTKTPWQTRSCIDCGFTEQQKI